MAVTKSGLLLASDGRLESDVFTAAIIPTSITDNLHALRQVYVLKEYLQSSADTTIALGCLPALIAVGTIINSGRSPDQLFHLLETLAIALEVLRNHDKSPDQPLRERIREYVGRLDLKTFPGVHRADFEIPFLLKRLRAALSVCFEQEQGDTFGGLVYDTASILLSQSKYDVIQCISWLDKSRLDWYVCWQIIKSMLLQHVDFSYVPKNSNGALYSVLDLKTAFEKLDSIGPTLQNGETPTQDEQLTRLDLLTYCALDAAHKMLPQHASLSRKGYLRFPEAMLPSSTAEIRFKAATFLCALQAATDSLLVADTAGDVALSEAELSSALQLRSLTAHLLTSLDSRPNGTATTLGLPYEAIRRRVNERASFTRSISRPISPEFSIEDAHLALIELDEWVSRQTLNLPRRVQAYFRENGLGSLLCPISERPMTDAVYVRCGKTVGQAALKELISGNIPASHCCCEEIHDDIEHILHEEPVIRSLAVEHLGRILEISEVVRYGDLPTFQRLYVQIKDEHERATLLRLAVTQKNIRMAMFLIESSLDVDFPINGETHLISAASLGSLELVTLLLQQGAQPTCRDSNGMTALAHAVNGGHQSVAETIFFRMTNTPVAAAASRDFDVPENDREYYAEALHEIWGGYRKCGNRNAIIYLRRAMELDPENHLYAEEMQRYLDEQEEIQSAQVYVSTFDDEGNLYEGFTVNGARSGAGKLTYSERNERLDSFDGEWVNGVKLNGLMVYKDGSQYHGDVAEGEKRHGQGVMYFPTGAWYEGSWKHDQMHGTCGRYCFANGDVYEGAFKKDSLDGEGKLLHANGDYYEGEWENGLKHGYGIYDLDSVGLRYQGYWREDKKHGVGWIIYPDGLQYKGEFINDEPVGEDSASAESPVRRFSTGNSTTDRESTESSRTDVTQNTDNSSPSLSAAKTPGVVLPDARIAKHQRSRSFAEIVGRKIKDPILG